MSRINRDKKQLDAQLIPLRYLAWRARIQSRSQPLHAFFSWLGGTLRNGKAGDKSAYKQVICWQRSQYQPQIALAVSTTALYTWYQILQMVETELCMYVYIYILYTYICRILVLIHLYRLANSVGRFVYYKNQLTALLDFSNFSDRSKDLRRFGHSTEISPRYCDSHKAARELQQNWEAAPAHTGPR